MFTAGILAQAADANARAEDNVVVRGKAKCKAVLLSDLSVEWFQGSADPNVVSSQAIRRCVCFCASVLIDCLWSQEFAGAGGNSNTAATVAFACANPDFFVSHSWQ